jgi:hypothetical protein
MRMFTAATVAAGLLLTGCMGPAAVPPEVTGAAKIAGNKLSELTASEILALADAASDLSAVLGVDVPEDFDIDLTQEQAEALCAFLKANTLDSVDDVKVLIEGAIDNPGSVVIPDGLIEIFLPDVEPNTVSAVQKMSQGQISTWTDDEVQSLASELGDLAPEEESVELSDEQAGAIVDFLVLNEINTLGDWEAVAADPDSAELPEGAEELFEGL